MSETTREKLSLIRKYIFEVVLIVLCFVVYNLTIYIVKIDKEMKDYIMTDSRKLTTAIEENTRVLRYFQIQNETILNKN